MRNNERYSAFSPAVSQAFLEVSDLRVNFYRISFRLRVGTSTIFFKYYISSIHLGSSNSIPRT
jgi:hypothetical protein